MSALQFLNKKSWHTSTIRNNEKRWLREQEAEKEQARIDELQKQLAEERRQEELQRLEEESGRVDASAALKRRRINWMYEYEREEPEEPGKGRDEKQMNDIMLGKKEANVEEIGDADRVERAEMVDMEAKMKEDPLFQMRVQMAMSHATLGVTVVANRKTKDIADTKALTKAERKEERRRIREERHLRREQRAIRKRRRTN